jgi:hypothetical protein
MVELEVLAPPEVLAFYLETVSVSCLVEGREFKGELEADLAWAGEVMVKRRTRDKSTESLRLDNREEVSRLFTASLRTKQHFLRCRRVLR